MAPRKGALAHDSIEEVIPGVWTVMGALPFPLLRTMTLVRLADGSLLLHSVIAMDAARMSQLEAIGRPSICIVPSKGHRMDAAFYKERYPDMRVVAPAAVRAAAEKVVRVDATAEEALPPLGIKVYPIPALKTGEAAYEVDVNGGKVLLFCDVVACPDAHPPGVGGALVRATLGGIRGPLGTPRMVKLTQLTDKRSARVQLEALAATPDLRAIAVAHGHAVTERCGELLREAAAAL